MHGGKEGKASFCITRELGELLDILASSIGSLTNPLKLSRTFKSVKNRTISDKTLKKYIDYMTDAFLIERARRFDLKEKRYIASAAKYCFEGIGLHNARLEYCVNPGHLLYESNSTRPRLAVFSEVFYKT